MNPKANVSVTLLAAALICLSAQAADLSRSMVYDLPRQEIEKWPGPVPGSQLTREDSLASLSLSSAENSAKPEPDPPVYENHSLMVVKPLSAEELPEFLRRGF